jgi:tRNA threonylcarbamoyladenosine biosynthesis protein TsaE
VEHLSDSLLDVELHRPLGASAPAASTQDASAGVLDFDTDDDDEPRTILIRGFGPRWAEQPLLPAALKGNS